MKIPLSPPLKRKIITPPFALRVRDRSGSETKERRNTSPFGKGDCRWPIGPLARREGDLGYHSALIRTLFQKTKMLQKFKLYAI
jgi:hypothetical protein